MLLNEDLRSQLAREFENLVHPVHLAVFSQALADPESEQVARLVEEVASLHPKLSADSYNFVLDREKVAELGIARTPAVAVLGAEKDHGIRFYGLPSGYEFGTLVEAVIDVSKGESQVSAETRAALDALERPVHVQVFSTPT